MSGSCSTKYNSVAGVVGSEQEVSTSQKSQGHTHAARLFFRLTPHASRLTPHASRLTPHASRLTPHASRLTPHASRLTPHASPRAVMFQIKSAARHPAALLFGASLAARYIQYTKMNRNNHTTSPKCQYQATAPKPK